MISKCTAAHKRENGQCGKCRRRLECCSCGKGLTIAQRIRRERGLDSFHNRSNHFADVRG